MSKRPTPAKITAPLAAVSAATALVLTACVPAGPETAGTDSGEEAGLPVVLTTFTVLQDMAAEVGGEHVEVRSITPAGAEVHGYDPTPSAVRGAAEADLVIANGLGLEAWLQQFLQHADAPTVTATDGIDTLAVTRLRDHPDHAGSAADMPVNPHAWMSPVNAEVYIDNIEAALAEQFPQHTEHFAQNAAAYRQQLQSLHRTTEDRFASLDAPVRLVTCEGAFSYLAQEYGIDEHYLWSLNAQNEGTAAQTEAQINYVEAHSVPTIFCESTVNDSAQQQVAAETGAELGPPLYVDSLTDDGDVPTYLDLLEYDIDRILSGYE